MDKGKLASPLRKGDAVHNLISWLLFPAVASLHLFNIIGEVIYPGISFFYVKY